MKRISIIYLLILAPPTLTAQDLLMPAAWDGYYNIACSEKLVESYANTFYMCRPSFSPEYALSIVNGRYSSQSRLVLKRATENLGYNDNYPRRNGKRDKWDKHHKYHDVAVESYNLEVKADACSLIYNLVKAANETATYFNGEKSGCDGVAYYFYSAGKYGRTWSPNKKCRTGRLVAAMDSICRAVELGDTAMLTRQLPTCHTLLGEFRNEYPMAAFKPMIYSYRIFKTDWVSYVDVSEDTAMVDYIYLTTDNIRIKRMFPQPVEMQVAREWTQTLSDRVAQMSRNLFLTMPGIHVGVLFEDGHPEEYYHSENSSYHYLRLTDTTNFERRCLAAPLDNVGLYRSGPDGTWQAADTSSTTWWNL